MPIIDLDPPNSPPVDLSQEPEEMSQELYDTIRTYVDSGLSLHPEHARALLYGFEDRHAALEQALHDGGADDGAFELVLDSDGDPLIELAER